MTVDVPRNLHFLRDLADALPPNAVVTDEQITDRYRFDHASTVTPGTPIAVVRPADTAQVQATVRVAAAHSVPIVTRGAGTGLSGGAAAVDGCVTLSTERMRSVHVDAAAMLAVVGPGLLNSELKAEAVRHGLWYPPDPSSLEVCTIGGNVATNAGGLCCVRYGVTTDYVLGLQVVLADGTAVRVGGRTVKDVAGYDLKRLFVGSEGTLGVVTEATVRLRACPPAMATVVATFDDVVDAGHAVTAAMAAVRPATLELMDRTAVAAVERVRPMGFSGGIGALLLAQIPIGPNDAQVLTRAFEAGGATYVAATEDADEGDLLLGARRMAVGCVERLGRVLIEDVCVPIPQLPAMIARVGEIARRTDTTIPVIGHAGDGNLHPLVTFDPTDPDAVTRAHVAFDEVMAAAVGLGGTVTGEHGIGSLKASHLVEQLGPEVMDVTRRIKSALDPQRILNPGKWI